MGEGSLNRLTITLEPISDAAIDRLLEFLMSTTEGGAKNSVGGLLEALLESGGREPDARRHQLRRILASGSASCGTSGAPAAAACRPPPRSAPRGCQDTRTGSRFGVISCHGFSNSTGSLASTAMSA